jgi:hypothetical protein
MRTLLASLLLGSLIVTTAGCPMGCSAFQGSSDKVYARGQDQLILCENGGYTVDLASGTQEGFYTENAAGTAVAFTGTDGATAAHAFDLSVGNDGSAMIPQFGATAWTEVNLDQVALDHADARCRDLETRTWWATSN